MVVSPSFISHYLLRFKKFCAYIKKRWVDKEARRFLARLETTACLKQGIRRTIGPMNKVVDHLLALYRTHRGG